ncbi:hypothetical protein BHE74_00021262 [Ensete ventricosum]|nr:hypothetical protein BHE74_00021262 [Ensete ventricosum]
MHRLRFPNSGLRAKGQPATIKAPYKGAAGHGQPPLQGQPVATKAHCKGVVGHLQGAATRGRGQQGRRRQPQGWSPLSRAAACRNAQRHRLRRGSGGGAGG